MGGRKGDAGGIRAGTGSGASAYVSESKNKYEKRKSYGRGSFDK